MTRWPTLAFGQLFGDALDGPSYKILYDHARNRWDADARLPPDFPHRMVLAAIRLLNAQVKAGTLTRAEACEAKRLIGTLEFVARRDYRRDIARYGRRWAGELDADIADKVNRFEGVHKSMMWDAFMSVLLDHVPLAMAYAWLASRTELSYREIVENLWRFAGIKVSAATIGRWRRTGFPAISRNRSLMKRLKRVCGR